MSNRRRRKYLAPLVVIAVLVGVALFVAAHVLFSPKVIHGRALDALREMTGMTVSLGEARVHPSGGFTARRLVIEQSDDSTRVRLEVDSVTVEAGFAAVLSPDFVPRSITLDRPVLEIVRRVDPSGQATMDLEGQFARLL